MDRKKYKSDLKETYSKLIHWKSIAIVLLFSNVLLSLFVIFKDYSEKIIVLPSDYSSETSEGIWIKGKKVSPSYIESMARDFSNRLLTFHPKNVRSQFNYVVLHSHPSVYSELKSKYDLDADRVERNQLSSAFHIMKIHIQGMTAFISGVLESKVGKQSLESKVSHFEISFLYEGKIYLKEFKEVSDNRKEE